MSQILQTVKDSAPVVVPVSGVATSQGALTADSFNNFVILGGTVGFWTTAIIAVGASCYAAWQIYSSYKNFRKELDKES